VTLGLESSGSLSGKLLGWVSLKVLLARTLRLKEIVAFVLKILSRVASKEIIYLPI
jgi:hypothetical protein